MSRSAAKQERSQTITLPECAELDDEIDGDVDEATRTRTRRARKRPT